MSSHYSIVNTGDYLIVLKALIEQAVDKKAVVSFLDEDNPQDKVKPFILLPMPRVIETGFSCDGRHEDTLLVSVLFKIPKNIPNATIEALNVSGYVRALMVNQTFKALVNPDDEAFDSPEDIDGDGLNWDTNEAGYIVTFTQVVRYGTVDNPTMILRAIDIKERFGEAKRIYEREDDS